MSVSAELLHVPPASGPSTSLVRRVRRAALAVPLATAAAGLAAGIADVRAGLFAAAVVLGWTQLVGL